jgi:hypothetical protein
MNAKLYVDDYRPCGNSINGRIIRPRIYRHICASLQPLNRLFIDFCELIAEIGSLNHGKEICTSRNQMADILVHRRVGYKYYAEYLTS